MCPGSPITQISTPVEILTRKAGSFCLCCFSLVVSHLWSLHMSGIPRHTYLHPDRNFYPTSWFILSVLSLHMSGIPHHMDLQSGRNIYWTSWVIQSVFFFDRQWDVTQTSTLVGMSTNQLVQYFHVVFDRQWDVCGPYMCPRSPVTQTFTLVGMATNQLVHSVHVVFARWWDLCGPYMCLGSPVKWTSTLVGMSTSTAFSVFDKRWDICGPYTSLGSPFTWTSTRVGMSTCLAGSFCLCCFWQVVRHLCSLHVSAIPHHIDLHPARNIYPTSRFILSVFVSTGG